MESTLFDMSRYTKPVTKANSERASLIEPFISRLNASRLQGNYRPYTKAYICKMMAYIATDDLGYFYKKLDESKNFPALWHWYCVASDLNKK